MKTLWCEKNRVYDGSQLQPLKNYLNHDLLGNSLVTWVGPCAVDLSHMIDGEDLKVASKIEADKMLHFVLELFDFPMAAAIGLQRLMGELTIKTLMASGSKLSQKLVRKGDDLYLENKKLNVSIATCSKTSSLIHFGINVVNDGTPVETCSLHDFGILEPKIFALALSDEIQQEFTAQRRAFMKVKTF